MSIDGLGNIVIVRDGSISTVEAASLRAAIHGAAYLVPPSGDATGVTDGRNIAQAFQSAKSVLLAGMYSLDTPLQVPTGGRLLGWPRALITYTGSRTKQPVLTIAGQNSSLREVDLYCQGKARGIRCQTVAYTPGMLANVIVRDSVEVGVDVYDCWGSGVSGVAIVGAFGVALRSYRCNSVLYENVQIAHCHLLRHADASRNTELWEYACDQGVLAAREKYGDEYLEARPADLADHEYACCVITGPTDLNRWVNVLFEPVMSASYPVLATTAHMSTFSNVRLEAGWCSESLVEVQNLPVGSTRAGRWATFQDVSITLTKPAKYFVRAMPGVKYLTVQNLYAATYLTGGIIHAMQPPQDGADLLAIHAIACRDNGAVLPGVVYEPS